MLSIDFAKLVDFWLFAGYVLLLVRYFSSTEFVMLGELTYFFKLVIVLASSE